MDGRLRLVPLFLLFRSDSVAPRLTIHAQYGYISVLASVCAGCLALMVFKADLVPRTRHACNGELECQIEADIGHATNHKTH